MKTKVFVNSEIFWFNKWAINSILSYWEIETQIPFNDKLT